MTDGQSRLFAYGTLMAPAVWEAVCGAPHPHMPGTLVDYARYAVRGQVFPGIVPLTDAATDGVVFDDIDAGLWHRLDAFESGFYERRRVVIEIQDRATVDACTYVVRPEHRQKLSRNGWTLHQFTDEHLDGYLARYT